jgi:hypothetical protein
MGAKRFSDERGSRPLAPQLLELGRQDGARMEKPHDKVRRPGEKPSIRKGVLVVACLKAPTRAAPDDYSTATEVVSVSDLWNATRSRFSPSVRWRESGGSV